MPASTISTLPTELVLLIAKHLQTPEDLFAFIRTSHRNCQIFKEDKATILEAVIRNTIPSTTLLDAVKACEASEIARLRCSRSPEGLLESEDENFSASYSMTQRAFIEQYFRQSACDNIQLHQRGLILPLYKLWWVAGYFVADFKRKCFSSVYDYLLVPKPALHSSLSRDEKTRLYRAFFRFETYRKLFSEDLRSCDIDTSTIRDGREDKKLAFFKLFSSWEREELLSVHEYLFAFTQEVYRELETYVVESTRNLSNEILKRSQQCGIEVKLMGREEVRGGMVLECIHIFGQTGSRSDRKYEYFVARGLPFLRWLVNLPTKDKLSVISDFCFWDCKPSLHESLFWCWFRSEDHGSTVHSREVAEDSSTRDPNCGWIWARPIMEKRDDLREMGYVFWDASRLQQQWGLQAQASFFELQRRWHTNNYHSRDSGHSSIMTLLDIPIPLNLFKVNAEEGLKLFEGSDAVQMINTYGSWPLPFSKMEAELFDFEY